MKGSENMKKKKTSRVSNPQEEYKNKWVALSHNEKDVIVAGHSFIKTIKKARSLGEKEPVMYKVPPKSACLLL